MKHPYYTTPSIHPDDQLGMDTAFSIGTRDTQVLLTLGSDLVLVVNDTQDGSVVIQAVDSDANTLATLVHAVRPGHARNTLIEQAAITARHLFPNHLFTEIGA